MTAQPVRRRWALIGLAAVATILALLFAVKGGPPQPDDQRIRQALADGAQAIEAHNVPALMALVSKDYHDDMGFNRDRLRLLAIETFRDQSDTWVTLDNVSVRPHGDSATVTANVTLETRDRKAIESHTETHPVTLQFRKEPGYRFLVIPTDHWRVVQVSVPGASFDSDSLGF